MASPLDIINLALLVHLGREPLAAFEAPDDEASELATGSIMRLAYPVVRDRLLVANPWNFSIRRAQLAQLDDTLFGPLYMFAHAYQLPEGAGENEDPLRCLRVLDTNLDPSWGHWWPWSWWSVGAWPWPFVGVQGLWQVEGRTLVSDELDLKIRYAAQVTDTSTYPPAFVSCFAYELAAEAAFALTRDNTTAARLRQEATNSKAEAIKADAREGGQMRAVDTTLTEVR